MVGIVVGSTGLALSLTLTYLSMRAVMSIGGSCASGGPYVIAQPCPKGTAWMMMVGIFGGLASTLVLALTAGRGPQLWTLAWPGLFLSLGWNFLDFGLDPPEVVTTGGWVFCGVLFMLMGGLPLLAILRWAPRATFWGTDAPPPGGTQRPTTRRVDRHTVAATVAAMGPKVSKGSVRTRADATTPPWVTTPASSPSVAATFVDELERLAGLRAAGDLTDEQYEAAKARLLGDR